MQTTRMSKETKMSFEVVLWNVCALTVWLDVRPPLVPRPVVCVNLSVVATGALVGEIVAAGRTPGSSYYYYCCCFVEIVGSSAGVRIDSSDSSAACAGIRGIRTCWEAASPLACRMVQASSSAFRMVREPEGGNRRREEGRAC